MVDNMRRSFPFILFTAGMLGSLSLGPLGLGSPAVAEPPPPARPVPLIFDTDIGNDVDDVLALGMIHALQTRGDCELRAVTITKDHPEAAAFTDAVNTFYGRGSIPIGVCQSGVTPQEGKFIGLASVRDAGAFRYPHDLLSAKQAPPAVTVLRQALAEADDHSVAVVQVGFSTNLANLLASPPDDISPLPGRQLVAQKARLLSIMAGAFAPIPEGKGGLHEHREYNIIKDVPANQKVNAEWPTPIVWSGYEIGIEVRYPHESIEQDYDYVQHHPLAEAYVCYNPPPHDRPSWDLTSVLYAVHPERGYFDLSPAGEVSVADDGLTVWKADNAGNDRYLIMDEIQRARTVEALVQLASQPPQP